MTKDRDDFFLEMKNKIPNLPPALACKTEGLRHMWFPDLKYDGPEIKEEHYLKPITVLNDNELCISYADALQRVRELEKEIADINYARNLIDHIHKPKEWERYWILFPNIIEKDNGLYLKAVTSRYLCTCSDNIYWIETEACISNRLNAFGCYQFFLEIIRH